MYTHLHIYVQAQTYMYQRAYGLSLMELVPALTSIHRSVSMCMYVYSHAHTRAYVHAFVYTRTYMYTCALTLIEPVAALTTIPSDVAATEFMIITNCAKAKGCYMLAISKLVHICLYSLSAHQTRQVVACAWLLACIAFRLLACIAFRLLACIAFRLLACIASSSSVVS
jgi:hypothetical protein